LSRQGSAGICAASGGGQELATEAAMASRDYAFERLGVERLVASIHPENTASRRVAEKIGMTL